MNWTFIRRETGLIEHGCEHGVGHPNHASIERMKFLTGQNSWGIHGCDGCCSHPDFEGNVYNTLVRSWDLYDELDSLDYLDNLDGTIAFRISRVVEWSFSDEDIVEQLRCAQLDLLKLKQLVKDRKPEWHDEYRNRAEFMYWGLVALMHTDDKSITSYDRRSGLDRRQP